MHHHITKLLNNWCFVFYKLLVGISEFFIYLSKREPLTTLQLEPNIMNDIKYNCASYLGYIQENINISLTKYFKN